MALDMFLEFPFSYAKIEKIGVLFYPTIQLQLKTIFGWRYFDFLVDTGADLTTLPATAIAFLGIDCKKLEQSKIQGVGGIFIHTWDTKLPIKIGNHELLIQVSITKDKSTPFLLGRKDIFEENFNLLIDSRRKVTVITENT